MNCSYSCDDQPLSIEPYADISGPGVIASFTGTAYMVILFLLIYYIFIFDPKVDPFRVLDDNISKSYYVNPVDDTVLRNIRSYVRALVPSRWASHCGRLKSGKLEATFNKCVLVLADMQIVTGLAILISGFSSINCRLSSYHWQIIVYLAWLSSLTHLSTLTFLRSYFNNHPAECYSRLVLMLALITLLCAAAIPTASFHFNGEDASNFRPSYFAICFYKSKMNTGTVAFQSMITFLFLSIYNYTIRIAKLSERVMTKSHRIVVYFNERFNNQVELWKPLEPHHTALEALKEHVARPLLIALIGVIIIQLSLFSSVLAEIYWLVIALAWGSLSLFGIRSYGPTTERAFTFGQVLPLVMLAAPLFSIFENLIKNFYPCESSWLALLPWAYIHAYLQDLQVMVSRPVPSFSFSLLS
ncbi:hypothetical protein GGR53DRAFT_350406 [Hypoxylon sp. FL1150]|nr:hypothetical protein GGR53DRAFT_350406 [Hypoxylon sp. FL1150]